MSSKELEDAGKKIKVLSASETVDIVTDLDKYLEDYQVHNDEVLDLLAKHAREIQNYRHFETSNGVLLRRRAENDARRTVLNTREQGTRESPCLVRDGTIF